jgi:ornithine cyclodeaminase/alanine dehydrogenase-like protein (mu-crystallin family)
MHSTANPAPPAPFVDAALLTRILTPRVALSAVQRFFARHRRDEVFVPERIHLHIPGTGTIGLYMPAATSRHIGVKLAHLMPQRRPNVEAEIFFYEAATGKLLFWGDGKPLTALRTAAMSAAGALRLLPACRRLVVFGNGVQAAAHILAFAEAYPDLETIEAVTRGEAAVAQLKAQLPGALARRVSGPADPALALPRADCIVTTTPAPAPIFDPALLPDRCHIAAIGSAAPAMNEIAPAVFRSTRVWLDTRNALKEAGDCRAALQAGWREDEPAGDAFDLLGPQAPPAGTGRTMFKTVGHAAQDLALLLALWEVLQAEWLAPR